MTDVQLAPPEPSMSAPARPRHAWADNLEVVLVAGVIVGHATMSWTGVGTWVVY